MTSVSPESFTADPYNLFPSSDVALSFFNRKMPLDHYKIDKLIGKGSYGEVKLVKHKKDKKQVST